ncbi:MAG: enoyl-CoA hydratase [Deltaproteobacteria bacterium HGW-Deltaproteobacteria-12]|jgi:enoyl-CoA hydratase/carnithine racemase|nr:MAG: enoyl-CoA hydratase [Deltaproteobacteria bacterium HGW-Deltaproteobacteria-12]
MSYSKITVETRDHVLYMGLNRPEKLNAFDIEMHHQLALAYGELDRNPDLRCGLLYAHGKHFTSGLELDKWAAASPEEQAIPDKAINPLGKDEAKRCRKPVVMAVQGICFTIGFELMLAQDIRVVASNARIALLEVKRGVFPTGGGTVRLFQEIGWGNAMRYLLTGDEISGTDAYRLGLAQELAEPGKEFEIAAKIATDIAKRAPLAVMACINSSRFTQMHGNKAAFARIEEEIIPILASEDAREGVRSFLERREANFQGR